MKMDLKYVFTFDLPKKSYDNVLFRFVVQVNQFVVQMMRYGWLHLVVVFEGAPLTVSLAVPSSCSGKHIDGLRYLWRQTPCLYKQATVYNGEDSDLPAPPYIHYF